MICPDCRAGEMEIEAKWQDNDAKTEVSWCIQCGARYRMTKLKNKYELNKVGWLV